MYIILNIYFYSYKLITYIIKCLIISEESVNVTLFNNFVSTKQPPLLSIKFYPNVNLSSILKYSNIKSYIRHLLYTNLSIYL